MLITNERIWVREMAKSETRSVSECPTCDSKNIREETRVQVIADRRGDEYRLDGYSYTHCGDCGFDFVTGAQGRINERLLENAKRASCGLLPTEGVRAVRKKYGLRQEDASEIFGGGKNAFSKYERGYITQSVSMDRLLRVADRFPEVVPYLRELAAGAPKRSVRIIKKRSSSAFQIDNAPFDRVVDFRPRTARRAHLVATREIRASNDEDGSWTDIGEAASV